MALLDTRFTESNLSLHERLAFDTVNRFEAEDALSSAIDEGLSPEDACILEDLYIKSFDMTHAQLLELINS